MDLTNQGFVGANPNFAENDYNGEIFKSKPIENNSDVKILNIHTGTGLGYIQYKKNLIPSVKWLDEQEEIEQKFTILFLNDFGEIIQTQSKKITILYFDLQNSEWYNLNYNEKEKTYFFEVVKKNEVNMPTKFGDKSIFLIEKVYPTSTKEFFYGDLIALKNLKSNNFFSKSAYDGCSTSKYPIFKDNPKSKFPTDLTTQFIFGGGAYFCQSAECDDLTNNNKKYDQFSGCTMLYWQILPDKINNENIKIETKSTTNENYTNPELIFYAFVPFFFLVIILIWILFYLYF